MKKLVVFVDYLEKSPDVLDLVQRDFKQVALHHQVLQLRQGDGREAGYGRLGGAA